MDGERVLKEVRWVGAEVGSGKTSVIAKGKKSKNRMLRQVYEF